MATIALNYFCDLNQAVKVQYIDGNVFSGDNAGNTISVFVMDGDQPATIGGSVSADVIRADGSTVAVSGALDGNRAYVILPQACYAVPGSISIVIKNTQNTTITTIAALVGNVYRSSTDEIVDPGTIIPSISSLIAAIDAAIGSIPADYSALLASIAADYSSSKTYPVGAYCWEAGVLKRCIVPITSAETYTAAHWTNAVIGDDLSALKSAFNNAVNNTVFRVGTTDSSIEWESGTINSTGGGKQNNSKRIRVGNTFTITDDMYSIQADAGYTLELVAYASDNTYIGIWNGTTFEKTLGLTDNEIVLVNMPKTYKYRIVLESANNIDATYYNKCLVRYFNSATKADIVEVNNRIDAIDEIIEDKIVIPKTATTTNAEYSFKANHSYKISNAGSVTVSVRTRATASGSDIQQIYVGGNSYAVLNCTTDAAYASCYSTSDYTVTVEDMGTLSFISKDNQEKIDGILSDGVPSYFRTMMNTKLPMIRANMNETGQNGDSFVFITDIHWGNNAKHSLGLIKYIINNTNINKVLCGGDIISQGEVADMLEDMNTVIKGLEFPFHNDLLVAFGNHDSNILSDVADSHFDLNTCYAIMEKEAESYITMMTDYDLSFYYDSLSNKTRYIVLDTGEDSSTTGRVFTAYQEFADTLLATPTGWNIVIMAHIVTYGRFLNCCDMMDAYNEKTTYSSASVGTFDFTGATGKIICAFGGHTHVDSVESTTGGIPVIVTGTDSSRVGQDPEYPYVIGTDQEQCFDVVTINYTEKTIKCVRIGRGIDRTVNYQ